MKIFRGGRTCFPGATKHTEEDRKTKDNQETPTVKATSRESTPYAGGGLFKGKRWLFVAARWRVFEGKVLFHPFGFPPVGWPE